MRGTGLYGPLTHIAIQEKKDGKVVEWMEHVSNDHYHADAIRAL
jgi:hypothetical protein